MYKDLSKRRLDNFNSDAWKVWKAKINSDAKKEGYSSATEYFQAFSKCGNKKVSNAAKVRRVFQTFDH